MIKYKDSMICYTMLFLLPIFKPLMFLKDILPQNEKFLKCFLLLCIQVNLFKVNNSDYLED